MLKKIYKDYNGYLRYRAKKKVSYPERYVKLYHEILFAILKRYDLNNH